MELFGLDPSAVGEVLADQFRSHCPRANLGYLSATEAWDGLVLPLRCDGGVLVCAITEQILVEAIELLERAAPIPVTFVIAEPHQIEQFIAERYDFEGIEVNEPPSRSSAA